MTILSFDVEANGLHGQAFAVAGVLMDETGTVISEFVGRCPIEGEVDPWVAKNVLPQMKGIPQRYKNAKNLRTAFWRWYKKAKAQADFVVAENPYPVEAGFLLACQHDALSSRYWEHPFPLIDIGTVFFEKGYRQPQARERFTAEAVGDNPRTPHNPHWDAWATALVAFKLLAD